VSLLFYNRHIFTTEGYLQSVITLGPW